MRSRDGMVKGETKKKADVQPGTSLTLCPREFSFPSHRRFSRCIHTLVTVATQRRSTSLMCVTLELSCSSRAMCPCDTLFVYGYLLNSFPFL